MGVAEVPAGSSPADIVELLTDSGILSDEVIAYIGSEYAKPIEEKLADAISLGAIYMQRAEKKLDLTSIERMAKVVFRAVQKDAQDTGSAGPHRLYAVILGALAQAVALEQPTNAELWR
jgi:hypothetical protein